MPKKRFDEKTELEIIEKYKNGMSAEKLGKEYKCHGTLITSTLNRYNIEIRPKSFYYASCNENFFENIDTEEKAYYLGLFYADGNVHQINSTCKIGLLEPDKYLLVKLGKLIYGELYTENSISTYVNSWGNNFCEIYLTREKIKNDLIKHGCIPNKWDKIRKPNISDNLMHHFIRGFLDGDGSVTLSKYGEYGVALTSNYNFVDDIGKYIKPILNIKYRLKPYDNICDLRISSFKNIKLFLDYIYKDATVFMKRKHDRYLGFLIEYDKHKERFKAMYAKDQIIELFKAGMTTKEISKQLNINHKNVKRRCSKVRKQNEQN